MVQFKKKKKSPSTQLIHLGRKPKEQLEPGHFLDLCHNTRYLSQTFAQE